MGRHDLGTYLVNREEGFPCTHTLNHERIHIYEKELQMFITTSPITPRLALLRAGPNPDPNQNRTARILTSRVFSGTSGDRLNARRKPAISSVWMSKTIRTRNSAQ